MLKKILLGLLSLASGSFALAQKKPVRDQEGHMINYQVSALESKIPVIIQPDSLTRSIQPYLQIPNDPLGTAVILQGATTITLTTRLRKDSLDYYRYTLIENDTSVIVSDARLEKVDFVWNARSSKPGFLTMNFGISQIAGKKITLKVWRLPKAHEVTTVIIYNKPLPKPELLNSTLIGRGDHENRMRPVLTPIKRGQAFSVSKNTQGIWLQMKRTDLDFIYRAGIRKKGKGDEKIIFVPNNWDYNTFDKNPACSIDALVFDEPGEYELFIVPLPVISGDPAERKLTGATFLPFSVRRPPVTFSGKELLLAALGITAVFRDRAGPDHQPGKKTEPGPRNSHPFTGGKGGERVGRHPLSAEPAFRIQCS